MPGENCAVFGCGSCRRTKGIGIWKLLLAKDEAHVKWKEEWLSEIKKIREIDQNFRELIKHDRVYTCEKHSAPEDKCTEIKILQKICTFNAIFTGSIDAKQKKVVIVYRNILHILECIVGNSSNKYNLQHLRGSLLP